MRPFDLFSHAVRAKEILTALTRNGFAGLIEQLDLPAGFWQRILSRGGPTLGRWERVRVTAEELGPTFVKAGQVLSMRPDLVPQPLILELRKLQDRVHPQPFTELRAVLEEDLGGPLDAHFTEFGPEPVASGSLAQVYFARLRADGREVAVKVQRPNLAKPVETDLEILHWLAVQVDQRVPALRPYNLPAVVEAIREGIRQELDFTHEARNLAFFAAQNPFPDKVFGPRVEPELSTARVLVMERIVGRRVDEAGLDRVRARELAEAGARSIFHQIVITGFFHADPHAGNVLITPDGRLCLLDWGLAGHLTRRLRYALADFFVAAASQDPEAIVTIADTLAAGTSKPDIRAMEREVTLAMREHFNRAIQREEVGAFILRLLHIFGRNGISLTRDYSLMAKAILSIEEIGRALDPGFDLARVVRPVLVDLQRERYRPSAIWRRGRMQVGAMLGRLADLPAGLDRLLRRLEADELTVNLTHRGLEDIDDSLNAASSRLTIGIIIGALIIGSSMVMTTGIQPRLFGYPALGVVGYLLSALLGLWIVWDIVRHGRHR